MELRVPKTLAELQKLTRPLKSIYAERQKPVTRLDKLAVFATEKVGSMGFFFIILGWTVIWLAWNAFAPKPLRFDAYPGFVLWLFISNLIQILLMPLIMVGQNIQGRHAEIRAQADFEVNKKSELEIESILLHLEKQDEMILEILKHMKSKTDS
jgi:uncharacterized membrane protein